MKAFRKEITDHYRVVQRPAAQTNDYLLANEIIPDQGVYVDFCLFKKEKLKGTITFAIREKVAISLPKVPFGGFWVEEKLNSEAADFFIEQIDSLLQKSGINQIRIIQAPKPYQAYQDLFAYLLHGYGFFCEQILSYHFFLGKKKIQKMVVNDQAAFQKKVKSMRLEVFCGAIQNFGFLKEIREWNKSKGYEVNLEDSRLIHQVSAYPDRYFLISLYKGQEALAHTVAVKLTSNSLYYFQSGINPKSNFKNLGELVLMRLFQLAASEKSEFVDLGSSQSSWGTNHSLMFFKSRFSNDISNRMTWVKNL